MRNENHRTLAVNAFNRYMEDRLPMVTYRLSELGNNELLEYSHETPCIYVLRLNVDRRLATDVLAIPNTMDNKSILYIGGHPSRKNTNRFNTLIISCRKAQRFFEKNGFAKNDSSHEHSVAGCLTTSLLKTGFKITDCQLDLIEASDGYDELELLIGYQERFHHLPPWNSSRGGASAFETEAFEARWM